MARTTLRAIAVILNVLLLGIVLWETAVSGLGETETQGLLVLLVFVLAPSSALYFLLKRGQ